MVLKRVFLSLVVCAFGFVMPVFAAEIDDAQNKYLSDVDQLVLNAKASGKVRQDLIDSVLAEAKTNSDKVRAAAADASKIPDLQKAADDAKAKEQSTANKLLGGITMAATGIGGMQLAQGLAERSADEAASAEMTAYLDSIVCGVSGGPTDIKYNAIGQTPPESRQLTDARYNYVALAAKMKTAKESLGMAPGIESELLIDTSKGLYDNAGTDTNGITHHFDTATERADSNSGRNRAIVGGAVLGVGAVGGAVGNWAINGGGAEKIKSITGGDKDSGKSDGKSSGKSDSKGGLGALITGGGASSALGAAKAFLGN